MDKIVDAPVTGDKKDEPLREDIRFLGRILGDVVRDQEGDYTFEIVEKIRKTSIRFHRDADAPATCAASVDPEVKMMYAKCSASPRRGGWGAASARR